MWFFRLSGHHKYFPKSEHKIKTTFGVFDSFVLFPTCTCSGKLYKSVIRCKYMVDLDLLKVTKSPQVCPYVRLSAPYARSVCVARTARKIARIARSKLCFCKTPPKLKVAQTRNRCQSKEEHPGKVLKQTRSA